MKRPLLLLPLLALAAASSCCSCSVFRPPSIFNQVRRFENEAFPARRLLVFPYPETGDFSVVATPIEADATKLRFDCLYEATNIVSVVGSATNVHSYAWQFWSSGHVACYHAMNSPSDFTMPTTCNLGYFALSGDNMVFETFSDGGYESARAVVEEGRLKIVQWRIRPWRFGPFQYGWPSESNEGDAPEFWTAVPITSYPNTEQLSERTPFW